MGCIKSKPLEEPLLKKYKVENKLLILEEDWTEFPKIDKEIKSVHFNNYFFQKNVKKELVIPNHIKYVKISTSFINLKLPRDLQVLEFSDYSSLFIDPRDLPNSLKVLLMGDFYSDPLGCTNRYHSDDCNCITRFPRNMKIFEFNQGGVYNNFVGRFPQSTEEITFPKDFILKSDSYDFDLPKNLSFFRINNEIFKFKLPESLDTLILYNEITQELKNLPRNLRILEIYDTYNYPIILPLNLEFFLIKTIKYPVFLPQTLKALFLTESDIGELPDFPENMEQLIIQGRLYCDVKDLPRKLQKLKLILTEYEFEVKNLPEKLEVLHINTSRFPKDNLPSKLKKLHLFGSCNLQLDNLPESLERLSLGRFFNKKLDFLPKNLKILLIENWEYKYDLLNVPAKMELRVNKDYKGKIADDCKRIDI